VKYHKNFIKSDNGFSTNEIFVVTIVIGILATLTIPNFTPAIEFVEILIAEKYLLKSVKECQIGIVNFESAPRYTMPKKDIELGVFKKNKYSISYTGVSEECYPEGGGNILRISKVSQTKDYSYYSLSINVVTGERTHEGALPDWLSWWSGKYTPIISENDTYFLR
tara:strand:- start:294 stop:791 length:498 start_codon:yes stop_codon:yes gene_type:complete